MKSKKAATNSLRQTIVAGNYGKIRSLIFWPRFIGARHATVEYFVFNLLKSGYFSSNLARYRWEVDNRALNIEIQNKKSIIFKKGAKDMQRLPT